MSRVRKRGDQKDGPQEGEESHCEREWHSKMRLTGTRITFALNTGREDSGCQKAFQESGGSSRALIRVIILPKGCCYSHHRGLIRETHHADRISNTGIVNGRPYSHVQTERAGGVSRSTGGSKNQGSLGSYLPKSKGQRAWPRPPKTSSPTGTTIALNRHPQSPGTIPLPANPSKNGISTNSRILLWPVVSSAMHHQVLDFEVLGGFYESCAAAQGELVSNVLQIRNADVAFVDVDPACHGGNEGRPLGSSEELIYAC